MARHHAAAHHAKVVKPKKPKAPKAPHAKKAPTHVAHMKAVKPARAVKKTVQHTTRVHGEHRSTGKSL